MFGFHGSVGGFLSLIVDAPLFFFLVLRLRMLAGP
jgi:hypothetical protein